MNAPLALINSILMRSILSSTYSRVLSFPFSSDFNPGSFLSTTGRGIYFLPVDLLAVVLTSLADSLLAVFMVDFFSILSALSAFSPGIDVLFIGSAIFFVDSILPEAGYFVFVMVLFPSLI
jgi:hypothetical protein